MSLQFPTNPVDNQIFRSGSKTYVWIESKKYWKSRTATQQILDNPNTIAGYGITDVYTKSEIDNILVPSSWINYVSNWLVEPEFVATINSGDVYKYTYLNSVAYRLVPNDNISIDSFFQNFNGTELSTLLVQRGNL